MFLLSLCNIFLFCECHLLQELKLSLLISKINETETAMAQIETAASEQLQSLALQSEQALEGAQKKLLAASEKLEEFTTFVKVWVNDALLTCTYFRQRPCPPPEDLAETSSSLLLVVLMLLFGTTSLYIAIYIQLSWAQSEDFLASTPWELHVCSWLSSCFTNPQNLSSYLIGTMFKIFL